MKTLEKVISEIFNTLEEALQVIFTTESKENHPIPVRVPVKHKKRK